MGNNPLAFTEWVRLCWADLRSFYGNSYDLCYLNIYGSSFAGLLSSYSIHLYGFKYLWQTLTTCLPSYVSFFTYAVSHQPIIRGHLLPAISHYLSSHCCPLLSCQSSVPALVNHFSVNHSSFLTFSHTVLAFLPLTF